MRFRISSSSGCESKNRTWWPSERCLRWRKFRRRIFTSDRFRSRRGSTTTRPDLCTSRTCSNSCLINSSSNHSECESRSRTWWPSAKCRPSPKFPRRRRRRSEWRNWRRRRKSGNKIRTSKRSGRGGAANGLDTLTEPQLTRSSLAFTFYSWLRFSHFWNAVTVELDELSFVASTIIWDSSSKS